MTNLQEEFEKQILTLTQREYPVEVINRAALLKEKLSTITTTEIDFENGHVPFVIVITNDAMPTEKAMKLAKKNGKEGITKLYPHTPEDFEVISDVELPNSNVYLLVDIDRGKETINHPPNQALKIIKKQNRSPLTIDEGVAIMTHYPEFLIKNNCFSLLASRHAGDQRVPAIWINGHKHPNLGWCWDGNPHTWLGSASCGERMGV